MNSIWLLTTLATVHVSIFLDDASDEVTKPRSVNVNLRPTQVHLVLIRRFFLILKRAYESGVNCHNLQNKKIIG